MFIGFQSTKGCYKEFYQHTSPKAQNLETENRGEEKLPRSLIRDGEEKRKGTRVFRFHQWRL
jgi:uncharacterized membrane-anchored protein YhcB (DUF1043 family)